MFSSNILTETIKHFEASSSQSRQNAGDWLLENVLIFNYELKLNTRH